MGKILDHTENYYAALERNAGRAIYLSSEMPFVLAETKKFFNGFQEKRVGEFKAVLALSTHESPLELRVQYSGRLQNSGRKTEQSIGRVTLAFESAGRDRNVLITAIQGKSDEKEKLMEFDAASEKKWSHYLVQTVIDHAYALGYNNVKFIRPERQMTYLKKKNEIKKDTKNLKEGRFDAIGRYNARRRIESNKRTMDRIKGLYTDAAESLGFRRTEGSYWVLRMP